MDGKPDAPEGTQREGRERIQASPLRRCFLAAWRPCTEFMLESLHGVQFRSVVALVEYNVEYKKGNLEGPFLGLSVAASTTVS